MEPHNYCSLPSWVIGSQSQLFSSSSNEQHGTFLASSVFRQDLRYSTIRLSELLSQSQSIAYGAIWPVSISLCRFLRNTSSNGTLSPSQLARTGRYGFKSRQRGDWVSKLKDMAEETGSELGYVRIDGPYEEPDKRFYNLDQSIIVGAGVGIMPFSGFLHDLRVRSDKGWKSRASSISGRNRTGSRRSSHPSDSMTVTATNTRALF
jgi:hypothetical protein